ncbi:MAG: hypothetical protein ACTSXW_04705 [Candidatus Baldrarchaeia archaeon]
MTIFNVKMNWKDLIDFYEKLKDEIENVKGYDYSKNLWIKEFQKLIKMTTISLIIFKLKSGDYIHIQISPEVKPKITLTREDVNKISLWKNFFKTNLNWKELNLLERTKQQLPHKFTLQELKEFLENLNLENEEDNLIRKTLCNKIANIVQQIERKI